MKQDAIKTTILVGLICAIVFLLYKRRRDTPVKTSDKMLKELYSIKDALIPKEYIEQYRSGDNNGLTIVGTIMEQGVDIMIAILKQGTTKEMIDTFVKNPNDATTIAEAIETVGAQIVSEIGKNDFVEKKDITENAINTDGTVVKSETRTIFRPNYQSITVIAENGVKAGIFKVLKDETKYDKYYDAIRNVILDVERKTNPDATDERFPTKEKFKTAIIPDAIKVIEQKFRVNLPPREVRGEGVLIENKQ